MTLARAVKPIANAFRSRPGGRRDGRLQPPATTVPEIAVEAPALDIVGFARDHIEERRDHFFRLDHARGAALSAHHSPECGPRKCRVLPPREILTRSFQLHRCLRRHTGDVGLREIVALKQQR